MIWFTKWFNCEGNATIKKKKTNNTFESGLQKFAYFNYYPCSSTSTCVLLVIFTTCTVNFFCSNRFYFSFTDLLITIWLFESERSKSFKWCVNWGRCMEKGYFRVSVICWCKRDRFVYIFSYYKVQWHLVRSIDGCDRKNV